MFVENEILTPGRSVVAFGNYVEAASYLFQGTQFVL